MSRDSVTLKKKEQMLSSIEHEYVEMRSRFDRSVADLVRASAEIGGTPTQHGREYWSSILLAKLALTAITVDRIVPHIPEKSRREIWDLGSVATLVRGMAENYLLMYWLCTQAKSDILWDYKLTLLKLVDNHSRIRLIEGTAHSDEGRYLQEQTELQHHLKGMSVFTCLPPKRQRELLKADKLPFIQDEVIDALSLDKDQFRRIYRYLSSFVHTGTISFFRMEMHNRGNGEKNEYEVGAIGGALELAVVVIDQSMKDIRTIHV